MKSDARHAPKSPAAVADALPPVYPVNVPPLADVPTIYSPNKRTSDGNIKSKVYGPQAKWSDRKAMSAQKVSLTNRYLDEGKKLTPRQQRVFKKAVGDAINIMELLPQLKTLQSTSLSISISSI